MEPHPNESIIIHCLDGKKEIKCQNCSEVNNINEIKNSVSTSLSSSNSDYSTIENTICANCECDDSIIEHGEYYICLNCLLKVHYDELIVCEWCGQNQIDFYNEDYEYTHLYGCSYCDGYEGHMQSKGQ